MPLVSLMKQQKEKLSAAGYIANVINDYDTAVSSLEADTRYLLVSPEVLCDVFFRVARHHRLLIEKITHVFIDESHCVSKW